MGSRHRGRQQPALRRADGVRRPPRRLLRHARRVQALPAGPHHRRLARPRRTSGPPDGAPDARAAHPPRQGDEQRLHRAGAAGGDGQHVRGLSRARRASAASPSGSTRRAVLLANALRRLRYRVVHDDYFDTVCVEVPEWALPRLLDAARARMINLRPLPPTRLCIALDETVTLGDLADIIAVFSLNEALPVHAGRHRRQAPNAAIPRVARARARPTWPIRYSTCTTRRPRCCATSSGSRRATSRSPRR